MCSVTLHCQVPEAFRRTRAGGRCDAATVPICTDVYPPSRALYAAGSDAGAAAAALLPFLATTVDGSLMLELAARAFAKRMYGDGTPACAGANGSVTCQTAVPLAAVPGMIIASTPGENLAAVPCPTGSYADPAPFESWCGDMTPSIPKFYGCILSPLPSPTLIFSESATRSLAILCHAYMFWTC